MIEQLTHQLEQIHDLDSLRAFHIWFWRQWQSNTAYANKLNEQLSLEGEVAIRNDQGYLCVGRPDTLVLLSMNPGFNEKTSARESEQKAELNAYLNLIDNYFEVWPDKVGGSGRWWSNAIGFLARLGGLSDDPEGNNWNYAAGTTEQGNPSWRRIAGWELFPFHSTSDGFSKLLERGLMFPFEADSPESIVTRWAKASFRALLRTAPEEILVASKLGVALAWQVLNANESSDFSVEWQSKTPFGSIPCATGKLQHKSGGQTQLYLVSRQLFSNWGAQGVDRGELIKHLRNSV